MNIANERALLVDTALGNVYPDVVIKGGSLVNVNTREIYQADIIIKGDRIAAVTIEEYDLGADTQVIHADGQFLVPGFIDPHMHLESSNVSVTEFAKAVVPKGVTTVVIDPHEIANVLGLAGIKLLLDEARNLPLNVFLRVPPRVPEWPQEIETNGAELTMEETKAMLEWDETISIAGDISPYLILRTDEAQIEKIAYTIELGKTVSGYSPGLSGKNLNAYIAAGLEDSHTPKDVEELLEDIRNGLRVLLTPRTTKFGADEFRRFAELVKKEDIDTRLVAFCTDDVWVHELLQPGHLDYRVRLAIQEGVDPIIAIQMATINTAHLYRMERDFGSISPGKYADIVIVDDLETVAADKVLVHGKLVGIKGDFVAETPPFAYPSWSKETMKMPEPVRPEQLQIRVNDSVEQVNVKAIVFEWPKIHVVESVRVRDGIVFPDEERDTLSLAVLDRHKGTGNVGKGFVKGIGIKNGAVASSVNHNSHNIFVIGSDFKSMAAAVNRLIEIGGGYVVAKDGEPVAQVELPIAGLISDEPYEVVAQKLHELERVLREELHCTIKQRPFYTLSFLCTPSTPHIGITDQGLFNADTLELEDVFIG